MKICTRCYNRDESISKVTEIITFTMTGENAELCEECHQGIRDYIYNPKKTRKKRKK